MLSDDETLIVALGVGNVSALLTTAVIRHWGENNIVQHTRAHSGAISCAIPTPQ